MENEKDLAATSKVVEETVCDEDTETLKKKKGKKFARKAGGKVTSFFSDFKKFISKGNIIDLAVALIIGTAFTKIVSSLVADIIMPLLGLILGKNDISSAKIELAPDVYMTWGAFVMAIVDFLIIAFVIFVVIRILVNTQRGFSQIKKIKKNGVIVEETVIEPKPIESTDDILRDIRELLRAGQLTSDEQKAIAQVIETTEVSEVITEVKE